MPVCTLGFQAILESFYSWDDYQEFDTPGHTSIIAASHPEHVACFPGDGPYDDTIANGIFHSLSLYNSLPDMLLSTREWILIYLTYRTTFGSTSFRRPCHPNIRCFRPQIVL